MQRTERVRGRGHVALRTRRTSEWDEKDGCLSLSRSLYLFLSFFVSFDHLSLSLIPRGEAEKERPMAG